MNLGGSCPVSQSWLRLPDLLGALGQFLSRVWGKSYFPPDSSLSKLKRGFDCNLFFAPVTAAQCLTGLSFLLHLHRLTGSKLFTAIDRRRQWHRDQTTFCGLATRFGSTATASRINGYHRFPLELTPSGSPFHAKHAVCQTLVFMAHCQPILTPRNRR